MFLVRIPVRHRIIRVPITGPPPAYLVGDQAFALPAFGPQPLESAEVVGPHAGEPVVFEDVANGVDRPRPTAPQSPG